MLKFDSSRAWSDAAQAVSANRDVLLALAGVFLVLPSLAFAVLVPQFAAPEGAKPRALLELAGAYYRAHLPETVAIGLLSIVGTLAMIALFTDRSRPTVGQAIRQSAMGTLTVIGAQLLLGIVAFLIAFAIAALVAGLGLAAIGIPLALAALVALIYFSVRISLLSPAVVIDGLRNPVAALRRSWDLTAGNAGRLLVFYLLLGVSFIIAIVLMQMVIGMIVNLIVSGETATVLNALTSSVLQAIMSVYFAAVIAASHRQLAGGSPTKDAALFD